MNPFIISVSLAKLFKLNISENSIKYRVNPASISVTSENLTENDSPNTCIWSKHKNSRCLPHGKGFDLNSLHDQVGRGPNVEKEIRH